MSTGNGELFLFESEPRLSYEGWVSMYRYASSSELEVRFSNVRLRHPLMKKIFIIEQANQQWFYVAWGNNTTIFHYGFFANGIMIRNLHSVYSYTEDGVLIHNSIMLGVHPENEFFDFNALKGIDSYPV